ncbi:MAG TPA: hypothetical protein EYN67_19995 [Flavobacteriales bacterium]|nr:hypothetical protein [Flavobacteriales bacterium]
MWDWAHFSGEGWWNHTKRSGTISVLLILAGAALIAHTLVPFWQQPEWLRIHSVAKILCGGTEKKE